MNVLGLSQPYMWMTIKTEKKKCTLYMVTYGKPI